MELKLLKALIEAAGYEAYSYSGRGMYGRQCVGLTCPDVNTAIADMVENLVTTDDVRDVRESDLVDITLLDKVQDFCEALRSSAQDSMGMDKVLYFKSVEWQDE